MGGVSCCASDCGQQNGGASLLPISVTTTDELHALDELHGGMQGGSMSSMTQEPREPPKSEKDMLRETVTSFLQSTVMGRRVTMLRELEGDPYTDRHRAILQVTMDREILNLLAGDSVVTVAAGSIVDVYTVTGDGQDKFPPGLISHLSDFEYNKLLRIHHRRPDGKSASVFLLEASQRARDEFLCGVRFLYAFAKRRAAKKLEEMDDVATTLGPRFADDEVGPRFAT